MKLLVFDTVNYIDYPTGGVLAYYRSMLPPCGSNLILVGISTDDLTPVGKWGKRTIDGITYDFFTLAREVPNTKRPLVPSRITSSLQVKRYLMCVLKTAPQFDYIFTQSHEVLSHIPKEWMCRTCFLSPGVGNPLSISRYPWARKFAKIYDKYYFMPKVSQVRWHLAAADRKSIEEFAERSAGLVNADDVIPFPTRYNDEYFKVMPRDKCRRDLNISIETNVFVTVGRLNWFKGWKLMIDAFELYAKQHIDSLLFFIGDGEDESKIRNYSAEKSLHEKVLLVGKKNQQEIANYLNAANVFVMGSFAEGWSTTLVEACACGVSCVVTEFSSAREMVHEGKNGFVVPNRDPVLFASRMRDAVALERSEVQNYDKQFDYLAQSKIMEELEKILR